MKNLLKESKRIGKHLGRLVLGKKYEADRGIKDFNGYMVEGRNERTKKSLHKER